METETSCQRCRYLEKEVAQLKHSALLYNITKWQETHDLQNETDPSDSGVEVSDQCSLPSTRFSEVSEGEVARRSKTNPGHMPGVLAVSLRNVTPAAFYLCQSYDLCQVFMVCYIISEYERAFRAPGGVRAHIFVYVY